MALGSNNDLELHLARRSLLIVAIITPLLLALVGFTLKQIGVPQWPQRLRETVARGTILAGDGTILAEGQAEQRRYPLGPLAAHLVGFSGALQPDGRFGLEGLEYALDDQLQAGRAVQLTIDPTLQAAAQAHLEQAATEQQAESGAVVILEAGSGRILAAASYPDFDPNNQAKVDDRDALINRAFLQQYEPGSVMKPFVIAALLESGRLSPDEVIPAVMSIRVGDKVFHDVAQHGPELPIPDILRYSSNVGMITLTTRFKPEELYSWLRYFGFGQPLELEGGFTRSGQLNPWQSWVPQDQASVTIGQSVSVTALQLAAAYSIFANNGLYIQPYLIEGDSTVTPRRILSPEVAQAIRSMLIHTVEASGLRHSKIPDVSVAGKTGTADVFNRQVGAYVKGDFTLSFAGMFPAETPRVTMVVYLQKPKIGKSSTYVAAPLFRAIGSEVVALWGVPPQPSPVAKRP